MKVTFSALSIALLATACSSSYVPAPSPRIAVSKHTDSADQVALGSFIGSLVASIAGAILTANAFPHAYDAVNIYDDGVRSEPAPPPLPQDLPPPPPLSTG